MKNVKFISFTASLVLAMAFTFSCSSSSDGGGGGSGGDPQSYSYCVYHEALICVAGSYTGCPGGGIPSNSCPFGDVEPSSSSIGGGGAVTKAKIGGVSQKGRFIEGATVALYELNDGLAQTGKSFEDRILDSKGSFEIRSVELASPYATLKASGYYRNEVTGGISSAPVTLFAISDIREKDNVNINILTHLEYYRVLNLAEQGKSVKDAKKQAQREIFEVFDINGEFGNSEDMSIFGTGEGDAALLAVSILLQGDLGEGEFSQRLMNFSQAINTGNGVRNNEAVRTAMADWASEANLEGIRDNIFGWRLSSNVPPFEKYIRNFVSLNYGLGPCDASNEGVVKKNNNEASGNKNVVCRGGIWKIYEGTVEPSSSSNAGTPSSSSEINLSSNSSSSINTQSSSSVADTPSSSSVVVTPSSSGISDNSSSSNAVFSSSSSSETPIVPSSSGVVPSSSSVMTSSSSAPSGTYGSVVYSGQTYRTVSIGEQVWFAENLNYAVEGSKCYDNLDSNCEIYGRLYNWSTAMGFDSSCNSTLCSSQVQSNHQGICPSGWHIPSDADWDKLYRFADGTSGTSSPYTSSTAGKHLKSKNGWNFYRSIENLDTYGFSALPGGLGNSNGSSFHGVGDYSHWWNAYEVSNNNVCYQSMNYSYDFGGANCNLYDKSYLFSVRCVQD